MRRYVTKNFLTNYTMSLSSHFFCMYLLCYLFWVPIVNSSELEKVMKNEKEPPFIESVKRLFSTKGFTRPLAAFICSISITNVVGE